MVTINQVQNSKNGESPEMPIHNMDVIKSSKSFTEGERVRCFISRIDKRFAVTDADFKNVTQYYEVFTEKELHETFNEV